MAKRIGKKDTLAAKNIFGDVDKEYDSLYKVLNHPSKKLNNYYSGHLDSMTTALKFADNQGVLKNSKELNGVLKKYEGTQSTLNATNYVQEQLKERQQFLQNQLGKFGLGKEFKKYQQGIYYYRAQWEEYKNVFENPKKLESLALKAVNRIPAFSNFFNKHSQLAGLFRLPGNDNGLPADIPGLQTRSMVMQELEQRIGSGPNLQNMMGQQINHAQKGLDKVKSKINELGNAGADMDMPDFKPNEEKTKSFLNRLELGTNLQSNTGNSLLPVSTNFGLSVGYRFSEKTVVGVGASYQLGWGNSLRQIILSHEGVGVRSFCEMKLKGSFWLSGGTEFNYRSRFNRVSELKNYSVWQPSVLIGVSKKYQISKKVKGNLQLLYDALCYRNVPRTQPVVFRVGYNFK